MKRNLVLLLLLSVVSGVKSAENTEADNGWLSSLQRMFLNSDVNRAMEASRHHQQRQVERPEGQRHQQQRRAKLTTLEQRFLNDVHADIRAYKRSYTYYTEQIANIDFFDRDQYGSNFLAYLDYLIELYSERCMQYMNAKYLSYKKSLNNQKKDKKTEAKVFCDACKNISYQEFEDLNRWNAPTPFKKGKLKNTPTDPYKFFQFYQTGNKTISKKFNLSFEQIDRAHEELLTKIYRAYIAQSYVIQYILFVNCYNPHPPKEIKFENIFDKSRNEMIEEFILDRSSFPFPKYSFYGGLTADNLPQVIKVSEVE